MKKIIVYLQIYKNMAGKTQNFFVDSNVDVKNLLT